MGSRPGGRRRALAVGVAVGFVAVALPMVHSLVASGEGVPFAVGDLFAAVGDGKIKHFDSTGRLVDTLDGRKVGEGGGMAFDGRGNLFAANFSANAVTQFRSEGTLVGDFGGGYESHPEAVVRDHLGNLYVGLNDGSRRLLKIDPEGNVVASFSPAVENRGIDWADLDADQCTLLYTSEGKLIKRFDVCRDEQLDDFATLPITGDNRTSPTSSAYAVRIRHNGEVMVATAQSVFRLGPGGDVLQTYTLPGTGQLLTLNLDADLAAFWTGDHVTGDVSKVEITSGATLLTVDAAPEPGSLLGGFAVFGEFVRAEPRLRLTSGGPVVVGQQATVTATLLNVVSPEDIEVTFTVTGSNEQTGTARTDASGNAVFRYPAANVGTDTISARAVSPRPLAVLESTEVSVTTTTAPATTLTYNGATSGAAGQPTTMAARLTDSDTNQPLAGASLSLGLRDGERCTAVTEADGVASCSVILPSSPGTYAVTAEFGGSSTAAPSSASGELVVSEQVTAIPTVLVWTGPRSGLEGEPVTLTARLVESGTGQPVVGAPVRFAVNETDTCGARTDGNGVASCQTRLTQPPGSHPVSVRSESDGVHAPASASAQLLVVRPTGPVQGGRAVVVSVTQSLLGDFSIADTGEVASEGSSRVPSTVLSFPGPLVAGTVADAFVETQSGSAKAEASVANLTIDLLGALTSGLSITLRLVTSTAQSSCTGGSNGAVRIGYLAVGPLVLISNEITVPANTKLALPDLPLLAGTSLTLNEQTPITTRNGNSLTVNALHLAVPGIADVVVSSAKSDVHGCAPRAAVS